MHLMTHCTEHIKRRRTCVSRSFAKVSASEAALRCWYAMRAVRTTTARIARASSGTTPAATARSAGLVRPITSSAPMTCREKPRNKITSLVCPAAAARHKMGQGKCLALRCSSDVA